MTPFPHSIDAEAPLRQARQQMLEHGVRHLPVTRRNRLVGLLTDRDLKRALDPSLGLAPRNELAVRDAMVRDVYIAETLERLDRVLLEMADAHIGSALVTKNGKLVGIFKSTDACRAFGEHLRTGAAEIADEPA
ncbi:MAG: CBS domain-containing protein [Myxococcales bacterium]|nr:CBS domain-containing protein [Myxococcales bacterium]